MENQIEIERTVKTLLAQLGEDVNREGLQETPARVAKAWAELLRRDEPKITVFDSQGYDQMVISRDIPFYTFCEHHLLPFFGTVTIGYLPKEKIIGLSKLARIVAYFARRLNTQEHFTQDVADYLQQKLDPDGVGVIVKGRHLCQEMRGARVKAEMTTSSLRGSFLKAETRAEFLSIGHNGKS